MIHEMLNVILVVTTHLALNRFPCLHHLNSNLFPVSGSLISNLFPGQLLL